MTNSANHERDAIFGDLKTMYERIDPPPAHLVDSMIAAVAAEDLDREYELLFLVERSTQLVGTRGPAESGGPLTVEFAYDDVTVLIRVADGPTDGTRRIDGWITPAADGTVRLAHGDTESSANLAAGRFEFAETATGLIRIYFDVADRADLATPTFEI